MRSDMRDVLISRPRWCGGPRRKGRRRPLEELPMREPMDRRGTKAFRDLLGPLKRFLASRVGRPWDSVWSELCDHLDRRGLLQRHVFLHLEHMVAVHVVRDGDVLRDGDHALRVVFTGRWRTSYLVDPDTGRLERAPIR